MQFQKTIKKMNQQVRHIEQRATRFRRWSRRSWAVFASLSLVVSIGVLHISVGEKSVLKAQCYVFAPASNSEDKTDNEGISPKELINELLIENIVLNECDKTAAACGLTPLLLINPKPLKGNNILSAAFLID